MKLNIVEKSIPYEDEFALYKKLSSNGKNISLLLESRSLNLRYGRESIIVPNPLIKITGKNESFRILALTKKGEEVLALFSKKDFSYADSYEQGAQEIVGTVLKEQNVDISEEKRVKQKNISFVLRTILDKFNCDNPYGGIYGAVAYDFTRNYYAIGDRFSTEPGNDFVFFLPSELYVFNDITKQAKHISFFDGKNDSVAGFSFSKGKGEMTTDISDTDYLANVKKIIKDIKNGRVMQCVYSRQVSLPLKQHPLLSYEELRSINPSPYSFFFNLGDDEILYGASPELHIKVQDKEIEIRPIAGTIKRSDNPLDDAQARITLLTDEKEKREHTMLVDLARNELYALCESDSVYVSDLFTIENYPNLYHLVSGVKGNLRKDRDAFDALLVTLPAGTLSGAPKQEAMKMIESYEASRRNFYGGVIGYFAFNGDCNTGITIRSVHVNKDRSLIRSGGGVVSLSTPEGELNESKLKMAKMVKVAGGSE